MIPCPSERPLKRGCVGRPFLRKSAIRRSGFARNFWGVAPAVCLPLEGGTAFECSGQGALGSFG